MSLKKFASTFSNLMDGFWDKVGGNRNTPPRLRKKKGPERLARPLEIMHAWEEDGRGKLTGSHEKRNKNKVR